MSIEENPLKSIIEGDFPTRIHELSDDQCTFELAQQKIEAWRQEGKYTVFNAGTYDLLTLNHILGLIQCRTLGSMALLGLDFSRGIDSKTAKHLVHEVAASDSIQLMITLDTNRGLENGKSRRPEKGGAPKPILDWSSRAVMLAQQSIPTPGYELRRNAVDYITRHGPDCCNACAEGTCKNEDNAEMAIGLQPHLVVVNGDSTKTVMDLTHAKATGKLPNTRIEIITETDTQYHDPILGGPVKTTSIARRIRS